jgi:predicted N-acyltransferase
VRGRVADSIRQLDPERWDALAGGEIAMSHRWQRAMEASFRQTRPRYVLLEDRRGPLATAVVNLAGAFGREGWREALLRRLTVAVGATFSARHCGIAIRPGADVVETLRQVETALTGLCRRETRPLVGVSNVLERDLPLWRAHGYVATRQRDHMVLDLPVTSYDQYLERLPRKDRAELRRVRRKGEEFGVDLSFEPLAGQGDRLFPLMAEVFARHGTPASALPITPAIFSAIAREMPGEAFVLSGRIDGQLAGFCLGIRQGDEMLWPVAGLRYEVARPSCLYFVLLDELIRWSIDQGLRRIYGGMTNERQKAGHGFQPHARWFCVRAHPGPLNRALGLALEWRDWSSRAPAGVK